MCTNFTNCGYYRCKKIFSEFKKIYIQKSVNFYEFSEMVGLNNEFLMLTLKPCRLAIAQTIGLGLEVYCQTTFSVIIITVFVFLYYAACIAAHYGAIDYRALSLA